jgi:hypothetical protein
MKNPYVARMEKAALAFLQQDADRLAAITALEEKEKAGRIAPFDMEAHKEQIRALHENYKQLQWEYTSNLQTITREYAEAVGRWAEVKGEDVPADVALLSGPLTLTREDLQTLAARHWTNYTAQRILMDYGKSREIMFRHGPTPKDKTEAMDRIAKIFGDVFPGSYNANLMRTGGTDQWIEQFAPVIGDSAELSPAR